MQKLKAFQTSTQQLLSELQALSTAQISYQPTLAAHVDDLKNRNQRNNIRLRGLPEIAHTQDLLPTDENLQFTTEQTGFAYKD